MTDAISLNISGQVELKRAFDKLSYRTSKTLIGNSSRAGAALFRKFARTYVPKNSGKLRRSMIYKSFKRTAYQSVYGVGFGKAAYYGIPLELGGFYNIKRHKATATSTGSGVRYQPANPMLRRALEQNSNQVIEKMIDSLWNGIRREAIKNAR